MEGRGPHGARVETRKQELPLFIPKREEGTSVQVGTSVGAPAPLALGPLSLALLAEPLPALQRPDPSPLSQGPGHLAAHGLGRPHQLTAQQWRQLCGCLPEECLQLQDGHAGLPPRHAHRQPVGLQEHHREAAGGRGAVLGLRPFWTVYAPPPRGSWLACPVLGATRGQGPIPGLVLTKGAGIPLA